MTYRDPDEPFGLGDTVRVLGTVYGTVVRAAFSTFSEPEYLVSYVDATGSPQKREWLQSELSFVKAFSDQAEADNEDEYEEDNVVPLRRA